MGSVAVPVKVARWVPVAVHVEGHLLGSVAVPVEGHLLALGWCVRRRHLVGDVFYRFGGRRRSRYRRGNAPRWWRAEEGRGVVDPLADRVEQIGGSVSGSCGGISRAEVVPRGMLRS